MSAIRAALALSASIAFSLSPAIAQDHLQPQASDLFVYPPFSEYHRLLRDELLTHEGEPYVAAVEIPSFSPEWALILGRAAGGRGRLEVRRARASIWYRLQEEQQSSFWQRLLKRSEPAGFESYETTVGPYTARAVASVWESSLRDVRYPPPSDVVCFDGSTYHFSLFADGEGQLTGSVHCPRSCSRAGELVGLLHRLRRFATLPEATRPKEQEILEYAQRLADPEQLESRIAECRTEAEERNALAPELRLLSRNLEQLADQYYCSCERWPETGAELQAFDLLDVEERRRDSEADATSRFSTFDFASAKLSSEPDGPLSISIPGREWVSYVPECFDVLPSRAECPR
jgi:hypothetical protein